MASQALYRKWRSQTFNELVGQEHVTQTLMNALQQDRVGHAYLFSGPRGTGKTSTARLLAKAVNCLAENMADRPCNECHICTAINEGRLLDLIEIDAASNTGVDDIRDLRDKVGFRPSEARIKFYIIDEVHMLSNSAFNALLKTLEEPPEHVIFVLATTEPEKIPATILSRCQRFEFRRIKLEQIAEHLGYIVREEGLNAEPEALEYIARQGGGSMRDAISVLDQLTAYGSETITLTLVQRVLGSVTSQAVVTLVDALIARDLATGLDAINEMIGDGIDARQLAREVVEYLRGVMLVKLGSSSAAVLNVSDEALATIQAQAQRADSAVIVQATNLFNAAMLDIKSGLLAVPQLPLELAFVEAVSGPMTVASAPVVAQAMPPAPAPASAPTPAPSSAAAPTQSVPQASPAPSAPQPAEETFVTRERESELTVDHVRQALGQVIHNIEMKNKLMAETLKNQAQLMKVDGNKIYFVTLASMKDRFEKPQPKAALNDAFSAVLNQKVSVHFSSGDVDAAAQAQQQGTAQALIQYAQDELDGHIAE